MAKRDLLGSASVQAPLRIFGASNPEPQAKTLRRRADGTLTFMDGTPVRQSELIPGEKYSVIEEPQTGKKKKR